MATERVLGQARTGRRRAALAVGALATALGLATVPLGAAEGAATYLYVGGAGCSDTGTGTATVPYCTIAKAAKVAVAGQTVLVASGTYTDEVFPWHSGAPGSPIVFRPATGASVTISGAKHGFTISNQSWITVSGFTIQNSPRDGIYVYNASGVTLSGNTVRRSGVRVSGSTAYGMYLNAMTSSVVSGNLVTDNSASGIFLTNGSTGNQVVGNESSWNAYGYVRNAVGIDLRAPGNLVSGNRVHDNEDSGIQSYPGGDRNTIVDNLSYHNMGFTTAALTNCSHPPTGNTAGCITGDHGIDDFGVTGSQVVGNTVYGNVSAGINLEGVASGTPSGFTIANNVAVDNAIECPDGAGGVVKCPRTRGNIRVDATSQLGTSVDFDLVNLRVTGTMMVWGSTSYTTLAAFRTASGQERSGRQADPLLTAPGSGDLRLRPGSPAIDSASSGVRGQPTLDAVGNPRVDDPATPNTGTGVRTYDDRGALEYQPPSAATADRVGSTTAGTTAQRTSMSGTAAPLDQASAGSAAVDCRVLRTLLPTAAQATSQAASPRAVGAARAPLEALADRATSDDVREAAQNLADDLAAYRVAVSLGGGGQAVRRADIGASLAGDLAAARRLCGW